MKTYKQICLTLCIICILLLISCQNGQKGVGNPEQATKIQKQSNNNSEYATDELPGYTNLFTPLTQQKVSDVRYSGSGFTNIEIIYVKDYNFDESGRPLEILKSYFRGGDNFKVSVYGDISAFKGSMVYYDQINIFTTEKSASFSKTETESILDYLDNNASYFYNHEEYDGHSTYLAASDVMCSGNYVFALIIGDPIFLDNSWQEQYFPAWAISKCVDEYPAPEHPLYGLFQILENDFIDEFE